MVHPFFHTPLRVMLVSSNFCRKNEPRDAYGASCLVSAFRNSPANAGDTLDVFTSDLNRFQKANGDFDIDWGLAADEIVTRALIGGYNVVAFSVFGWCERMVALAGAELRRRGPDIFIMLGGASIFGSEEVLRRRFPFADMFTLSYGEKIFANLRRYINQGVAHVIDLPRFGELESPYLSGAISLDGGIDTVRAETRRGCLFRCSFCKHRDTHSGKVYRIDNYERHLDELKLFKERGVKKLNVLDPLFNDHEGLGEQYLKLIRKVGFSGKVTLQIRPELLMDHFMEEASQNPNVIFEIGVQSLDPNVLKTIQRGGSKTEAQLRKKLDCCRELGIATMVTLIYGLPLQTYSSFARDIGIVKSYGVGKVGAFPLQVYAGTKLAEDIGQYGLTLKEDAFGIPEVVDNPTHDFEKMQKLAETI
ncbi:B12-binding domain-containing radical SAM protein [Fibrobacter sp. UBA3629]|uniref:B12-binding domain-containing radical SAM protein n=1 Tax=Fibrobacter sp. UBA3629 TaxID=1946530 RepID=UPI0025BD1401|nr:radical SAM protein [Fibrobacter sp. UBA3629]